MSAPLPDFDPKVTPDDLNELFKLLLNSVPIGVAVLDPDLRLRYINARHAAKNNLSVSDHIGKLISEFLPQAAVAIEPKIQFVLDTGIPLLNQDIVGNHPSPDGSVLHRLASYFPWRSPEGENKGVLAVIQDASVDQFSQQMLEQSQHRLLQVLDNLFAFVGVMELDGTITHANRAPLEAAGLSIADVQGKKIWDSYWFCHDESTRTRLMQDTERCRKGEVIRYDLQVRMIHDQRMWIDFMMAPLKNKDGHITHLIPSAMDISARHASEVSLQQSEERFQSIVESSDDAIITKTLTGVITSWNPAATRLMGYTADEAIGQPVTLLFPPANISDEVVLMQRISRGERVTPFETVRIHKNGNLIDVSVTISPLRDRTGAVVGACKLARDITLQKHQREVIEQALEEKTALLHEVHHRVKNNLQIVSSLLSLQARKAQPGAALALADCQGRIQAMSLVHQLLYESSNMAEVDLSAYIDRLVALICATCDSSALGVNIAFSSCTERMGIDIQRAIPCGLIVNELVLNAVKHAFPEERNGHVTIDLKLNDAGWFCLSVSDDGCGLPPGFKWGSSAGLGTQLIPLFVNQLQGTLTTPLVPQGSRFTIEFSPQLAEG
jgi:PAS domain S-box-containing protein